MTLLTPFLPAALNRPQPKILPAFLLQAPHVNTTSDTAHYILDSEAVTTPSLTVEECLNSCRIQATLAGVTKHPLSGARTRQLIRTLKGWSTGINGGLSAATDGETIRDLCTSAKYYMVNISRGSHSSKVVSRARRRRMRSAAASTEYPEIPLDKDGKIPREEMQVQELLMGALYERSRKVLRLWGLIEALEKVDDDVSTYARLREDHIAARTSVLPTSPLLLVLDGAQCAEPMTVANGSQSHDFGPSGPYRSPRANQMAGSNECSSDVRRIQPDRTALSRLDSAFEP